MKKLRHCHPICIIYHYKTLPSPCDHVRTLAQKVFHPQQRDASVPLLYGSSACHVNFASRLR